MNVMEESPAHLVSSCAMQSSEKYSRGFSKYEWTLVVLFILSLPLSNPWVRGDGVGYYAYARALLTEHRLDFRDDWLRANASFRMGRIDAQGNVAQDQYTLTGHLDNHFSIGPAILWLPFLMIVHVGVHLYDALGGHVPTDGFSEPYFITMAAATALYGFAGLWLSFRLAREYFDERWAFLATLGIWWGSSLAVYMYFNPSWSHVHSAFTVALFFWYWVRTRYARGVMQWVILGLIAALMMNVYYLSAVFLLLPLLESLAGYRAAFKAAGAGQLSRLLLKNIVFSAAVLAGLLPTLIAKKIIYGSYFNLGYSEHWYWWSPAFFKVCFSADHGLFSWTPILILAVTGLFLLQRCDRNLAIYSITVFVVYLYAIGCYQDWDGMSSFGNRFFVSLTPIFILGMAALFDSLARVMHERPAAIFASSMTAAFILWNLGLVFQWGTHLIPARGPISWRDAAHNQVSAVPREASETLEKYFAGRKQFMNRVEEEDVKGLKSGQSGGTE